MPRLSTHVLDTARGRPAGGIPIELHRLGDGGRTCLATAVTNADGRTDTPLLVADHLDVGTYELTFHVGDYLRRAGSGLPTPLFLDDIVVRVGIAEPDGNYHIPLLLAPHGYSVYRGS
ncbi:MAG TPA: hydroxyisourate hydrolase [Vicinamibacterales bacterium]|jgi:5-hydroxyisourate hydrolase|nr:hydroxyisourate hydrolase [Vicinamibacterales bacterium]